MEIKIYTSQSAILHPTKMIKDMFADLAKSKDLAYRLAKRDISTQYRQSILGYLWAFILPLVNTAIWLFLQGSGIIKVADTGIPYPVYVFSGTILWQIFTESFQSPINQVSTAKGLLSKLNFPKEALILSGFFKILFNTGIKVIILIPAIMLLGIFPSWTIIFFPLALFSIIFTGITLGLLLAPIGTLYTDIGRLIPLFTQFLMYFSPVVFAMPKEGITAKIFTYNIMSPLILTARSWLTGSTADWLVYFLIVNAVMLILFFIAWVVYRITMPILVERMSS